MKRQFHRKFSRREQPSVRRRELRARATPARLPMRLHTIPGPFPARCADDGCRHRSALSDYCISIRGQNSEERKQCIPEQAAWISRIVFRISRRFAKQNGHWFASGPPTLSLSHPALPHYLQPAKRTTQPSRSSDGSDATAPSNEPAAVCQPRGTEWHSLMRGNNSDDAMRFHVGGP